jgi:hypothetical protein
MLPAGREFRIIKLCKFFNDKLVLHFNKSKMRLYKIPGIMEKWSDGIME